MSPPVRLLGAKASPLASLACLVAEANLDRCPARRSALDGPPGVIHISATDIDDAVTLELRDGQLRVSSGGVAPTADVTLSAPIRTLLEVVAAPRLAGLPNPFTRGGRRTIGAVLRGHVVLRGAFGGRGLQRRLRTIMTADPDDE